ncbi:MAG: hypothetical protein CL949_23595 [Erythrobacter sp.]|nr:hypothetical protein [Erythrobacter sp.]MAM41418.1 hypothetical protein [Erythrobacter sp.]
MADLVFESHVGGKEIWSQSRGALQIGERGHDAEAAGQPRHAAAIGPMRLLPYGGNGVEHLAPGQLMDWQPVDPGSARNTAPGVPADDGTALSVAFPLHPSVIERLEAGLVSHVGEMRAYRPKQLRDHPSAKSYFNDGE